MSADKTPFSIWLSPCREDSALLSGLISGICSRYGAPLFEPHVTVISGTFTGFSLIRPEINRVTDGIPPLSLTVSGAEYSDIFFKTVYLTFKQSDELLRLHNGLKSSTIPAKKDCRLFPHLSLIYKEMDERDKKEIAEGVTVDNKEIVFDAVKAVSPGNIDKGWYDVDSWEVIFQKKLIKL